MDVRDTASNYKGWAGRGQHSQASAESYLICPPHPAVLPRAASRASSMRLCNGSDAVLEGFDRVGLHNLACGPGLHHDDLAEDLALASLRRRLRPRLQPAH